MLRHGWVYPTERPFYELLENLSVRAWRVTGWLFPHGWWPGSERARRGTIVQCPLLSPNTTGHRVFGAFYDRLTAAAERTWLGQRRDDLLTRASGTVLEIGVGTGANLARYRDVELVVATEPDPAMRTRLRSRLATATVPVEVSDAAAEDLPFPEGALTPWYPRSCCALWPIRTSPSPRCAGCCARAASCSRLSTYAAAGTGPPGKTSSHPSGGALGQAAIPTETRSPRSSAPGSPSTRLSASTPTGTVNHQALRRGGGQSRFVVMSQAIRARGHLIDGAISPRGQKGLRQWLNAWRQ